MTSPIGEDDLAAWIDGRLSPERQRLVDAYLEGQPDLHARLREQAEQARALASLFAPIADEPIPATMRVAAIRGGNVSRDGNSPSPRHFCWRSGLAVVGRARSGAVNPAQASRRWPTRRVTISVSMPPTGYDRRRSVRISAPC
jgi:anti-sigma factor RsiW